MLKPVCWAVGLAAILAGNASAQTTRAVQLTTPDKVSLVGTYYPAEQELAPAVLLLPGLGQTRGDWAEFARLLQQNGIAALTLDLRGHGDSTRRQTSNDVQRVDYRQFTPRDYQDLLLDVNAAVDWLAAQPEIDDSQIGIAGASLAANLAVRYALFNEHLAAVLLLSPGIVYHELRTDDAIGKIGAVPIRIIVSRQDASSFQSSQRLVELRKKAGYPDATNSLTVCSGSLHGLEILQGVRGVSQLTLDWFKQALLGVAPPPPPPPPPAAEPPKKTGRSPTPVK